jgi:hypothetical protein
MIQSRGVSVGVSVGALTNINNTCSISTAYGTWIFKYSILSNLISIPMLFNSETRS